jgi:iron complex outermembrane recepter protein
MKNRLSRRITALSRSSLVLACAGVCGSGSALAQESAAEDVEEVVVTGFRASLDASLNIKRDAIGSVDAIVAEDIAKFPDLNLAESIQRIPGVSIARDAGEGRQVTVRGLGPQFTRVRLNGMEAMSANGGTDASGGTNRDRSFDFNTFASELFNGITIRKTSAAEIEEGSLGATVDLRVARPFDYDGFKFASSIQGSYNDIGEDFDPRAALLISDRFADGRFGVLFSAAYTGRKLLDEGSSTVRWQNARNLDGTINAGAVFGTSDPIDPATMPTQDQLNDAFRPRIPRYDQYKHDQERLGFTASLQFQATERTLITFDALHAQFEAEREEIFLESPVFSANGMGNIIDVVPRAAVIDASNSIVYGVFDNVDIRSEARFDELETRFNHLTLDATHEFGDKFAVHGLIGYSESTHRNPVQTTLLFDRPNVDGYSFDFRNDSRLPVITYGDANVADPAAWALTQIRLRPQGSTNEFQTGSFELEWKSSDALTFKAGPQYKKFEFESTALVRSNGTLSNQEGIVPALPMGTPISDYSFLTNLSSDLDVPSGGTTSWITPDIKRAAELFDLYNQAVYPLGIEPALTNNFLIEEEDTGGFVQADLRTTLLGRPLRGNLGLRYVQTDQTASGYTFSAGAPLLTSVNHKYTDTLPSLNLSLDLADDFVVRLGAAKVMARPNGSGQVGGIGILAPGSTVNIAGANKTVSAGNPLLDPYRAKAYDLALEWYFAEESLLSVALFYKDISSFVQIVRLSGTFSENPLGLPDSVAIAACGTAIPDPDTCLGGWQFNLPRNSPGGNLRGFEVSYQQPFTFLPAPFDRLGAVLNYTGVESSIDYFTDAVTLASVNEDLIQLSKSAYNATLYYETERFGVRVSAAYRDKYLTTVPGRNNNNVEGTNDTLNVDFSASWNLNDNVAFSLEALNLTDEFQDQWVDSNGDRLSYYHHQGRQYLAGVRVKF